MKQLQAIELELKKNQTNIIENVIKPLQNKKDQKNSKKDTENCAPGNFFGPSYFVTTLASIFGITDQIRADVIDNILAQTRNNILW